MHSVVHLVTPNQLNNRYYNELFRVKHLLVCCLLALYIFVLFSYSIVFNRRSINDYRHSLFSVFSEVICNRPVSHRISGLAAKKSSAEYQP